MMAEVRKYGLYHDIYEGKWSSESLTFHQLHKLLNIVKNDDWVLTVDSDEFHEYPMFLPAFLAKCDKKGYNFVRGNFADRTTSSGKLSNLRPNKSIWKQYPLECQITNSLGLGTPKKIMAYKGFLRINRGHHRLASCAFFLHRGYLHLTPFSSSSCLPHLTQFSQYSPYPRQLKVHHFKWMNGTYEAAVHKAKTWSHLAGNQGSNMSQSALSVAAAYARTVNHLDSNSRRFCTKCKELRCKQSNFVPA
mmetsp:Transcript_24751/g.78237  ORF Transcript_24751/g.78237 Transcript_24751/m.78237 type:complete len:248 (+) Transcript_24751:1705-2448(+)